MKNQRRRFRDEGMRGKDLDLQDDGLVGEGTPSIVKAAAWIFVCAVILGVVLFAVNAIVLSNQTAKYRNKDPKEYEPVPRVWQPGPNLTPPKGGSID